MIDYTILYIVRLLYLDYTSHHPQTLSCSHSPDFKSYTAEHKHLQTVYKDSRSTLTFWNNTWLCVYLKLPSLYFHDVVLTLFCLSFVILDFAQVLMFADRLIIACFWIMFLNIIQKQLIRPRMQLVTLPRNHKAWRLSHVGKLKVTVLILTLKLEIPSTNVNECLLTENTTL